MRLRSLVLKRLEVRCCCQPQKLLGWLDVPAELAQPGRLIRFRVSAPWPATPPKDSDAFPQPRTIALPVEVFCLGPVWNRWPALKSEETPIEVLRLVDGFIEAKGDHGATLPE